MNKEKDLQTALKQLIVVAGLARGRVSYLVGFAFGTLTYRSTHQSSINLVITTRTRLSRAWF